MWVATQQQYKRTSTENFSAKQGDLAGCRSASTWLSQMVCIRKLESEVFRSSARQSYQKHGFKEQLNLSVISTAPGSSTVCNPMSYAPTTSEDQAGDTLTSGTEASPFAVRFCTAAKRSTTRVGREVSGFHS